MRAEQLSSDRFAVLFDDEADLREQESAHLAMGGLLLPLAAQAPALARVAVNLKLAGRGSVEAFARVVAVLPQGLALHLEGDPQALIATLLGRKSATSTGMPAISSASTSTTSTTSGRAITSSHAALETPRLYDESDDGNGEASEAKKATLWDRLRRMTPPQRIHVASGADRLTRLLLMQDKDPQIFYALLKNPRIGVDEVVRIARSQHLVLQSIELILRTSAWAANPDVRVALTQNPKTPLPVALRLLPTLPEADVRALAKGGAPSNALKQAALRRVQGGD
jgi:hypothetical protein